MSDGIKANPYDKVTARIVAMMEAGTRPWAKPWNAKEVNMPGAFVRPLRANGQPYRGVNTVNLWSAATERGFASPYWFTFKGAIEAGGAVRKGAKSELAFFVGKTTKTEERNGEEIERNISFLKAYCVFNADECDGLPDRYRPTAPEPAPIIAGERNATIDAFVAATRVDLRHGGNRAFCQVRPGDFVQMPHFASFNAPVTYYGTLLHELTHWTGNARRLDRQFGARFGDTAYAREELIAELGAAFLSADLGIAPEPREDHATYLASWIKVLKADNRAIFHAASHAEKAAGFLHNMQAAGEDRGEIAA